MMTMQEAFDRVYDHFVFKGGKPAIGHEGLFGTLEDADGNRCAIGVCVSDDYIRRARQGPPYINIKDEVGEEAAHILRHLMLIHDAHMTKPNFNELFGYYARTLAEEYHLSVPTKATVPTNVAQAVVGELLGV